MSENYKDTLNLPNTAFPMKANLAQREPEILKFWDSISIYEKIVEQNKNKPSFILNDGPPYANGAIHIGHAFNKTLKDIVLKSKMLSGFYTPFIPGWDCHGLPIEHKVEKEVGKVGTKVDAKTFRQKCREYANKQIALQKPAFIRLGVFADWENPYLTMDFAFEADIVRSLSRIIQNGHLHKGFKPVHWCIECGSALAEAEVEYQNKTSISVDVLFKVNDDRSDANKPSHQNAAFFKAMERNANKPTFVVIWTTTPWTLPANQAVAMHPEITYALVELADKNVILAKDLVESVMSKVGGDYKIIAEIEGKELEGLLLEHPFYPKKVPIIMGEHVTLDAGTTGSVHTAPAHGQEDFAVAEKYQLPLENPVGPNGVYIQGTPIFAGEHVFKANSKVVDVLIENNRLFYQDKLEHSYPHCWRHKTPLIFRATSQWFISLDQNGLRKNALEEIKKVTWIPSWGEARITGMVAERPDWCISRQRTWGVPMGLFIHKETGDYHPATPALLEKVAKVIEKSGIDGWHDIDIHEFLGKDAELYQKSPDTLDVWFDSGVIHYCVLDLRPEVTFPADLYLEGSDQHRGWFQSSLLTSVAMRNKAPYKQVLTHGYTVDADGRKMSKSLGNAIPPEKIVTSMGADILRLWASSIDYKAEITVSDEIFKRVSDIYRRIRNTARFLLANLNGFDPNLHTVPYDKLIALDQWIIDETNRYQKDIQKAYEDYQFHVVYQKIHHFCSMELGSFYLDVIKDRQYTGQKEGLPRRSAQTALYHIVEALVRWVAPILSFTAEEIWQNMPVKEKMPSVFLTEWYDLEKINRGIAAKPNQMDNDFWQQILLVRDAVNKSLEEARNQGIIGSGLEAEVTLYAETNLLNKLKALKDELRFVLITSQALALPDSEKVKDAIQSDIPGLWIKIDASTAEKCERCWHRRSDVNQDLKYPGICARCVANISGNGEERHYA